MGMASTGNTTRNATGTPAGTRHAVYRQPTFDFTFEDAGKEAAHGHAPGPNPIVRLGELPGPLAMAYLVRQGVLTPLCPDLAYLRASGGTVGGRAHIMAALLPANVDACARTAAWIWLGGDFPDVLDVLSRSHFRTPVAGRRLHPRARRIPVPQLTRLSGLRVTTPARTACDLAMFPADELAEQGLDRLVLLLRQRYRFTGADCLRILDGCAHVHTAKQARALLGDFTQAA